MKLSNSPKCKFCNDNDDIIHFMLYCLKVKEFWNSFFSGGIE